MLTNRPVYLRKDLAFEDGKVRESGHEQSEIQDLRNRLEQAELALDTLSSAMFFVDLRSRVVHRNRMADELVSKADGLLVTAGRLCCERAADTAQLHALVAGRTDTDEKDGAPRAPRVFAIFRPGRVTPLSAVITPLRTDVRHSGFDYGDPSARALVVVTDPEESRLSVSAIQAQFNLSPAEARLAAALTERQSIQEYAERAGITLHTARSLLKIVFSKLGVRRQSELVLLLARTSLWSFRPDLLSSFLLSLLFIDF